MVDSWLRVTHGPGESGFGLDEDGLIMVKNAPSQLILALHDCRSHAIASLTSGMANHRCSNHRGNSQGVHKYPAYLQPPTKKWLFGTNRHFCLGGVYVIDGQLQMVRSFDHMFSQNQWPWNLSIYSKTVWSQGQCSVRSSSQCSDITWRWP